MNAELNDLFRKYNLENYSKQIQNLAQNAIRISTIPNNDENLPVAASKLGGLPDLPDNISWPEWKGTPLSFLGQINLRDISAFEISKQIGDNGLLLFFYDSEQRTWGFDPEDRGSWTVIYCDSTQRSRKPSKPDALTTFIECGTEFKHLLTLPPTYAECLEDLGMTQDELTDYSLLYEEYENNDSPKHQLFGHPSQIQGEMQLECQLASNGIYVGNSSGYENPLAEKLAFGAEEWQLLMQFDSDSRMMWGDVGRLYFWIRKPDLAIRNFGNAWMILQCG